jgi:YesN/AraC family two-component response regulator
MASSFTTTCKAYLGHKTFLIKVGFPLITALSVFSTSALSHVISEEDHHAFEHKYADMCVKKEKANPNRVITSDDSAIVNMCECIAQEESKRLTIDEVKKFLRENKYPVSLLIKAGQAENICAQKMQQTKK